MNIKFKSRNRTLKTEWRNHMRVLPTGLHILPAICVNNWMPSYPFYHVSFLWLCWTWDVWWLSEPTNLRTSK